MMQPVMNRLAAEWHDTVEVVTIDVDKQWQLARQYGVRSLPTLLLIGPEGTVLERLTGFQNREDLLYRCEHLMRIRLPHT